MDKIPQLPIGKLSPEEQDVIWENIKGTPLAVTALQNGIIDPQHIRNFRHACRDFRTRDQDTIRLKEKAIILSRREEPVLVLGESGTGKELIAHILHGERTGDFVAVNVCAITETLLESELFGHVRGAFTGADKERQGLIKQAEGGTLFLDEIGDFPVHLQAKMLRVLQNRTYRKVGSNVDEPVRCRMVAATHQNIPTMVNRGLFRLDLYERLNVFHLTIKPLRNRPCDIEEYVGTEFANKILDIYHQCDPSLSLPLLKGNVRQLLNLKLRHEVFGDEELIEGAIL